MTLTRDQKHRVLREVYRHYIDYLDTLRYPDSSIKSEFIEAHGLTISFTDLKYGLKDLAKRKREAFFYNVILDWKQKDVAEHMGITTVSVGQYVEAAMHQLSKRYWADDVDELSELDTSVLTSDDEPAGNR